MSEYWKSVGHWWCKYCGKFISAQPQQKRKHETSNSHKNRVEWKMKEDRKKRARDASGMGREQREIAQLERAAVQGMKGSGVSYAFGGDKIRGPARDKPADMPEGPYKIHFLEELEEGAADAEGDAEPQEKPLPTDDSGYDPKNPYGVWVEEEIPEIEVKAEVEAEESAPPSGQVEELEARAKKPRHSGYKVNKIVAAPAARDEAEVADVKLTFAKRKKKKRPNSKRTRT